ncbi:MAG TPA: Uma2 family endonuclease [Trichocoleus sp.]
MQLKLDEAINQATETEQSALAFPELRCTFSGRSLVPDIAVFAWEQIPFETDGEVPNGFEAAPDWTIEILSPGQSQTRVMEKILFCLQHETRLGWLIAPHERAVICYQLDRLLEIKQGDNQLPVLAEVNLPLTVTELFGWLKVKRTTG